MKLIHLSFALLLCTVCAPIAAKLGNPGAVLKYALSVNDSELVKLAYAEMPEGKPKDNMLGLIKKNKTVDASFTKNAVSDLGGGGGTGKVPKPAAKAGDIKTDTDVVLDQLARLFGDAEADKKDESNTGFVLIELLKKQKDAATAEMVAKAGGAVSAAGVAVTKLKA
jgi:hypothetical protein